MINALDYALNRAKIPNADNYEDDFVMNAANILEHEDSIKDLQKNRFEYCTIILSKSGDPKLSVTDEIAFKDNLDAETKLLGKIASIRAFFNKLEPIFAEAQEELPGFNSPTLYQLEKYRIELGNEMLNIKSKLKDELSYRLLSYGSRRASIDEVEQDPNWLSIKESGDKKIEALIQQIELCHSFIERINETIGG